MQITGRDVLSYPVTTVFKTVRDLQPDLVPYLPDVRAVEVIERAADTLRLRARSAPGRVLVAPISTYTGWQATIDGQPARLYRVNHAMMGVVMPGGDVEVAFRFRPVSFVWGGTVSAIAWLLWLAAWARTKKRDDDSAIDEGAVS